MSTKPNPETCGDPLAKRFEDWLVAERNVSEHTRSGYMADLAQLASFLWGVDAQPPFSWSSVRDGDARRYLAALSKDGVGAATVLRKLASLRTFYRYIQRDGVVLGALDIKGVEAHAGGAYLQGHSAVKELAHKILKYYSFNDYEREIFYNVAPIRGGRPNGIVAGDAHMEFCVAGIPTNDTFPEVEANIESLAASNEDPVCETTVEHHILFPALERDERSAKAFDLARRAGEKIGMTLEETNDPTATDACWLCYFGVPTIDALGPVQSGMHTTEEKLLLTTIPDKTALFAVMLGMMQEEESEG